MAKGKSLVHKLDKETVIELPPTVVRVVPHFPETRENGGKVAVSPAHDQLLRHARSSRVVMMPSTGARNSANN